MYVYMYVYKILPCGNSAKTPFRSIGAKLANASLVCQTHTA